MYVSSNVYFKIIKEKGEPFMANGRRWTREEDEYLRTHYSNVEMDVMVKKLNRTAKAIRRRASQLKLNPIKRWTPEEEEYLKTHYYHTDLEILAKKFNKTTSAVKYHATVELGCDDVTKYMANRILNAYKKTPGEM